MSRENIILPFHARRVRAGLQSDAAKRLRMEFFHFKGSGSTENVKICAGHQQYQMCFS